MPNAPEPSADPPPTVYDAERAAIWFDEVAHIEARNARGRRGQVAEPIVFVGSSSIRLWTWLARRFRERPILNNGFGGSHLGDVLMFTDRLVLRYAPARVFLYAGDNDLGWGRRAGAVFEDWRTFHRRVRASRPNCAIHFISIKPSPARWGLRARIGEVNARVREFCAAEPATAYVDIHDAMLDDDGRPRPELYEVDGLHLSRAGYAVWETIIAPYLE